MRMKSKKTGKERRKGRCFFLLFLAALAALVNLYCFKFYRQEQREEKRFQNLQKVQGDQEQLTSELVKENPDMVGWLKIPKTSISYPVMQRKEVPEYYLHRNFDGNYSFYGTPFLDSRCRLQGDNLIIYGHNINGGRFFGALQQYREKSFFEGHPVLFLTTKKNQWKYKVVSVMETDTASKLYAFTDVYNTEDYWKHAKYLLTNSKFHSTYGIELLQEIKEGNQKAHKYQFLTLSTCRTGDGRAARLLIVAARKRQDKWEP